MFKITAKSVLLHPQGLRPRACAPTCPPPCYATGDMPKMHYFSDKFSKIVKHWGSLPQRLLIFDYGDLKLRDVAKFCFFKLIVTKSNFKKSVMTSF